MENIDTVTIDRIIHNFNRISGTIKADNSIFFRKSLNRTRTYFSFKRVQDVFLADVVPKRSFIKLDDNIHEVIIA